MPRVRFPRRGSKSFSPRKRASHFNGRIQFWPEVEGDPQLLGFAGYKAGMTHLFYVEDREKVPEFGQEVKSPATVIDAPPMLICAVRAYNETHSGLKSMTEIWAKDITAEVSKTIKTPRKGASDKELEKLTAIADKVKSVRVLAATQPKLTSLSKNRADLVEIAVGGGSVQERLEYAKSLLGKQVKASDIFKPGESIDIAGVTKGRGFQGPVKRWGIRILQNKSRKTIRGVASIGPVSPRTIHPNVPRAGQTGYHHRTEVNKRIMMLGSDGDRLTPAGGFTSYGQVKGDYIVLRGSVMGPAKRLIRIRKLVREAKLPAEVPKVTYLNTEWKKEQGN